MTTIEAACIGGLCRKVRSVASPVRYVDDTVGAHHGPCPRFVRFAMAMTNSAGSTGLGMCNW